MPFKEVIDDYMSGNAGNKKRKFYDSKLPKKLGLTHHTMKLMSEKPLLVMKTLGHNFVELASAPKFSFTFDSRNIYISGNYLKYCRGLSQTPWEIEGQRLVRLSLTSTKHLFRKRLPRRSPRSSGHPITSFIQE